MNSIYLNVVTVKVKDNQKYRRRQLVSFLKSSNQVIIQKKIYQTNIGHKFIKRSLNIKVKRFQYVQVFKLLLLHKRTLLQMLTLLCKAHDVQFLVKVTHYFFLLHILF